MLAKALTVYSCYEVTLCGCSVELVKHVHASTGHHNNLYKHLGQFALDAVYMHH